MVCGKGWLTLDGACMDNGVNGAWTLCSSKAPVPLTGIQKPSRAAHLLQVAPAIRSILGTQSPSTQFGLGDGCTVSSCSLPFRVAESPIGLRLIVRLVHAKELSPGIPLFPGSPADPQAPLPPKKWTCSTCRGLRYRVSEKPSRIVEISPSLVIVHEEVRGTLLYSLRPRRPRSTTHHGFSSCIPALSSSAN